MSATFTLIVGDLAMKRNRHTEDQVITILKAHERGMSVAELTRQNGVTEQTIYRWKVKYGGMEVSEAKRFRASLDQSP